MICPTCDWSIGSGECTRCGPHRAREQAVIDAARAWVDDYEYDPRNRTDHALIAAVRALDGGDQ